MTWDVDAPYNLKCTDIRNSHVWDDENLQAQNAHWFQQSFGINMWTGIVDCLLIGRYHLSSGHTYLIFLQEILGELLEAVSLDIRRRLWSQHEAHRPILQVRLVITLTDVSGRDG